MQIGVRTGRETVWLGVIAFALVALCTLAIPAGPAQALVSGGTPVNISPPQISGTPSPGNTLTCGEGTWAASPPVSSYTYQWNLDGNPIAGATSNTYVVPEADVGHQLTCTVTADNGAPGAPATSGPVTVVGNSGDGGGGTPTPPAPDPLPAADTVITLPASNDKGRCGSKRKFQIRVKQLPGVTYRTAAVFVNGKQVKVVSGDRLRAGVDLRGLPRGTFTAKIVVTTSDGRQLSHSRKYKTCTKKRGKPKRHKL